MYNISCKKGGIILSDQYTNCEKIICQLLEVQAQVSITPLVKHGTPTVYCSNSNIKPICNCCDCKCYDCNYDNCEYCNENCCENDCCYCYNQDSNCNTNWESCNSKHQCNFILTQVVCVEIPISIDADIDIDEGISCCSKPYPKTK